MRHNATLEATIDHLNINAIQIVSLIAPGCEVHFLLHIIINRKIAVQKEFVCSSKVPIGFHFDLSRRQHLPHLGDAIFAELEILVPQRQILILLPPIRMCNRQANPHN